MSFALKLHEAALFGVIRPTESQMASLDTPYEEFPRIVKSLQSSVSTRNVPEMLTQLQTTMSKVLRDDNARENFVACGGIDAVVGILLCDEVWFRGHVVDGNVAGSLRAWNMCLRILTELTVQEGAMPSYLHRAFPMLLTRALTLLQFSTTFENAVILSEHMMSSVGPMVVTDDGVWALTSVLEKLNERSLALLCRPMAMLLNFSPVLHTPEVEEVFTKAFVERARCVHALLDRNERRLLVALRSNFTLEKLVKLFRFELPSTAVSTQYGRTFALTMPLQGAPGQGYDAATMEAFMQYAAQHAVPLEDLLNQVAGSVNGGDDAEEPEAFSIAWFCNCKDNLALAPDVDPPRTPPMIIFPCERGELTSVTTTMNPAFSGPYMEDATTLSIVSCQSEVLYVLSTMLSSRYYNDVWLLLQSASTLDVLARLLPNVFAAAHEPIRPHTAATDPEAEAHSHLPETQRKIEYVRLVHEMWDARGITDAYRQRLVPNWSSTKRFIATVFVKRIAEYEEDPCVRNLLCYAVESYLRGIVLSERFQEQERMAVALVPHIVTYICTSLKLHKPESLFSLLGEVVKFSRGAMEALERALTVMPTTASTFQSVLLAHPYDCNLFLRSVLLTLFDTTVWARYAPADAIGGRCLQDTFADFISTVIIVREVLRDHPPGSLPASDILALIEARAPRLGEDVTVNFDTAHALLCSTRPCDDVQTARLDIFPAVCSLVLPGSCSAMGKMLYNMITEVELSNADSPDCICVITTSLLYFLLHSDSSVSDVLTAVAAAIDPSEGLQNGVMVDPFRNFFEVLCLWIARYSTRSHDTLVYCTHIPMSYWRATVVNLLHVLPEHFIETQKTK